MQHIAIDTIKVNKIIRYEKSNTIIDIALFSCII